MTLQIFRFTTLQKPSFATLQKFSNVASRKLLQRPILDDDTKIAEKLS